MTKVIFKVSAIILMIASVSFTSCETAKNCCGKKSCSTTDSASTTTQGCNKCGENSCDKNCSSNPSPEEK